MKPERPSQELAQVGPMRDGFRHLEAFKNVHVEELKMHIAAVRTTSQNRWSAGYRHYGPAFIRMTWHAAGTYRVSGDLHGSLEGRLDTHLCVDLPDLDATPSARWPREARTK